MGPLQVKGGCSMDYTQQYDSRRHGKEERLRSRLIKVQTFLPEQQTRAQADTHAPRGRNNCNSKENAAEGRELQCWCAILVEGLDDANR